jgi:ABC-2 type transport system ATP-binding protein
VTPDNRSDTAAIAFRAVSKRFGAAVALHGVDLDVAAGTFFGLTGVNGAGKTTLLKCMLDLTSADSGTIDIFGIPSSGHAARRRVSFLPERFSPPHHLNGRQFLRLMAGMRGETYDEDAARAMLERVDLDAGALKRTAKTYSKGMTQKLGLAACFLASRDLTVLDEPMSGLDPKARALVKDLLGEIRRAGGTLFFTSHALADVEEICDRVAILHAGRLRFAGAPAQLRGDTGERTLERAFLRLISTPATTAP